MMQTKQFEYAAGLAAARDALIRMGKVVAGATDEAIFKALLSLLYRAEQDLP
jgi:hypothetical protein